MSAPFPKSKIILSALIFLFSIFFYFIFPGKVSAVAAGSSCSGTCTYPEQYQKTGPNGNLITAVHVCHGSYQTDNGNCVCKYDPAIPPACVDADATPTPSATAPTSTPGPGAPTSTPGPNGGTPPPSRRRHNFPSSPNSNLLCQWYL